mgnify:CR=1 FL=1
MGWDTMVGGRIACRSIGSCTGGRQRVRVVALSRSQTLNAISCSLKKGDGGGSSAGGEGWRRATASQMAVSTTRSKLSQRGWQFIIGNAGEEIGRTPKSLQIRCARRKLRNREASSRSCDGRRQPSPSHTGSKRRGIHAPRRWNAPRKLATACAMRTHAYAHVHVRVDVHVAVRATVHVAVRVIVHVAVHVVVRVIVHAHIHTLYAHEHAGHQISCRKSFRKRSRGSVSQAMESVTAVKTQFSSPNGDRRSVSVPGSVEIASSST